MPTRKQLAKFARDAALTPFHGYINNQESNLAPLVELFPKWNLKEADGLWCAAFVLYCLRQVGFDIPYRPKECVSCNLAGCLAWEEFAMANPDIEYHRNDPEFVPEAGDIVLYDRVFIGVEHDHIGIVLEVKGDHLIAAEGNIFHDNTSGIVERKMDDHIRAFIRISDGFCYKE